MAAQYFAVFILSLVLSIQAKTFEPNWASLDTRPTPAWYDDVKFGIFIHWGVFSVPSLYSEWFWERWKGPSPRKSIVDFMKENYRPDFTYQDFASQFTAEFFNPDEWADIISASGAKYVVLTSKHHEGYTLWPSKFSWNWNAKDVGPNRDLVGDLATAIRKKSDIHFGLYHSLFEWFNRLYLTDKKNNFTTNDFIRMKTMPELYEIVNKYKPEIVWSDGDGEAYDSYWNSTYFLAWLFNESPVKDIVATNDRWGIGTACKHGGYYTCHDRYNPGHLLKHKWENCMTLDRHSWGYRRKATVADILSMDEITQTLAETVSCGGNLLMNIGPTHDGRIVPIFEERLRQVGAWLKVNGEAIYGTKPWTYQNDTSTSDVWYTSKTGTDGATVVYAIVLKWPLSEKLTLGAPVPDHHTSIHMLGYAPEFSWKAGSESGIVINIPPISANRMPCEWAWVFKITGLRESSASNMLFVSTVD